MGWAAGAAAAVVAVVVVAMGMGVWTAVASPDGITVECADLYEDGDEAATAMLARGLLPLGGARSPGVPTLPSDWAWNTWSEMAGDEDREGDLKGWKDMEPRRLTGGGTSVLLNDDLDPWMERMPPPVWGRSPGELFEDDLPAMSAAAARRADNGLAPTAGPVVVVVVVAWWKDDKLVWMCVGRKSGRCGGMAAADGKDPWSAPRAAAAEARLTGCEDVRWWRDGRK